MRQAARDDENIGESTALGLAAAILLGAAAVLLPPTLTISVFLALTGDVTSLFGWPVLAVCALATTLLIFGTAALILHRRRRPSGNRALVFAGVSVVAYTALCVAAYLVVFGGSMRRDLIVTDFQASSAPFPDGPQPGFTASTVAGEYEMVQTMPTPGIFGSSAEFWHTQNSIDASVEVTDDAAGSTADAIGIGCLSGPGSGVAMLVATEGNAVRLVDWYRAEDLARPAEDFDAAGLPAPSPNASSDGASTRPDGPIQTLRITCEEHSEFLMGTSWKIRGYVNGVEVIGSGSRLEYGAGVVLAFQGDSEGATARFGDVHVRHP